MKKRFSIFLNVAVLALCVCAIAIGVYSAKTASLNVTGTIGFTAHNCDVDISGYIYGHSTTVDGEPVAEANKVALTKGSTVNQATTESPLAISGTPGELKFGDVFFSDMGESGEVEPIYIELTITNKSKFAVLLDDNTTVAEESSYTAVCSNPLHVLYIDSDEEKTTTLQYILRPAKDSNGNYVNIESPVSVTLGMNFSKIDTDIVGNTADGWTVDTKGNLTAVPTKAQNNGSDTLIIPASVTDGTTTTSISTIGAGSSAPTNLPVYTKIVIFKSVTSIGNKAFYGSGSSLRSVIIPSSITSIGEGAFYYCQNLTSVTIPSGVASIGNNAFYYCQNLTSVTIPSGVVSIGNNAFYYCKSLTSVTIPESVTSMGFAVFYGCTNLISTNIPYGITSMTNTFTSCNNLKSITIPSSVTNIGNSTFAYCGKLTSIIIPSSVTNIGNDAFRGCSALTSITIPSNVTSIGSTAFAYCTNLTTVTFADTTKTWTSNGVELSVTDTALNATNLTTNYVNYTWTKNS